MGAGAVALGSVKVSRALSSLPGGSTGFLIVVNVMFFLLAFFLDFFELAFILVPLVASLTHQLVELLGRQVVDSQREQARQRQQALMHQHLSAPLAGRPAIST